MGYNRKVTEKETNEKNKIEALRNARKDHTEKSPERLNRLYPPEIDTVWVLSGPGTYFQETIEGKDYEFTRWMDRDRIRLAIALTKEITASKIRQEAENTTGIRGSQISQDDIRKNGPAFIYNGIPQENEDFKKAMNDQNTLLAKYIPQRKITIIEEYTNEDGETYPIRHTGDQIESFFQNWQDPESLFYHAQNIAIVSNNEHFVRIPHYLKYYEEKFKVENPPTYFAYGLTTRGVDVNGEPFNKFYYEHEMENLKKYEEAGDLSHETSPLQIRTAHLGKLNISEKDNE